MFDEQIALLEQSYAELVESVYDGLLLQTRLKGYMDSIDLVIDETGIRLDFAALEQMIAERRAINARDALGKVSRGGTPSNDASWARRA